MSERITAKEFREKYEFSGRGMHVQEKGKSAQDGTDKKKRHKYQAERTEVDGITFPSKLEAKTYVMLKDWERLGAITDLKVNAQLRGEEKIRYVFMTEPFKLSYEPDFTFIENGKLVIADAKGIRTKEYAKKRRLMKEMFGIEIREFHASVNVKRRKK